MLDVLVIGNSILDLVWSFEEPLSIDGKVMATSLAHFPGGQAANAAYTLGQLGFSVEFVGSFGDDEAGNLCKESLHSAGVKLTAAQTLPGCRSQTAAVLVNMATGTRTIAMYRASALALSAEPHIFDLARQARLVYVDGYEPAVQRLALHAARQEGRIRLADIEVVGEATTDLLDDADQLIVPHRVALALAGEDRASCAVRILSLSGPRTVIATDGANPFFVAQAGAVTRHAVAPLEDVDTTGVGDAFRAGYAAALLSGLLLDDCLSMAVATAESKLCSFGPRIRGDAAFATLRTRLHYGFRDWVRK
jgi:sugar/nucleoside kinase (ribokinase family)